MTRLLLDKTTVLCLAKHYDLAINVKHRNLKSFFSIYSNHTGIICIGLKTKAVIHAQVAVNLLGNEQLYLSLFGSRSIF